MNQKRFLEILNRYRLGQASAEERKMIDAWYEAMNKEPDELEDVSGTRLESDYWKSISAAMEQSGDPKVRHLWSGNTRPRIVQYALGTAASLLIAFISFFYVKHSRNNQPLANVAGADTLRKWERIANPAAEAQKFILTDGSSITLEPRSWVRISPDFNAKGRTVYLQGAAFFEVTHNEAQPFMVNTGSVITKVLGTSFMIQAFDSDNDVIVSVRTGRVSVFDNLSAPGEGTSVILTPNQEIIYDKRGQTLSRSIVDDPKPILAKAEIKRMRFENAPVIEIYEAIEKIYGIDIVFDEVPCTLTTTVSDGNLFKRLDIVTKAIGAEYAVVGDKIVVSKGVCD